MLVNIIQNTISSFRSALAAAEVITTNLKMWLGFETSETLGREEVVDGNFPSPNVNWSLVNGATISGNKANIIGDGSAFTHISQTGVFENGKVYQVVVDVTITSGLGLKFQDGANDSNIGFATTTGVYTFNFTGTSNAQLIVGRKTGGTAFNSSINSISVKKLSQITPDKSGNNNVGELFTGKALDFNGSTDYVNTTGFEMSGTSATFAFWIYPKDTAYQFVMDLDGTVRTILGLFNGGSGQVFAFFNFGFKQFGTPTQNQWQRVVFRVNATTVECYVDGVKSGSTLALTSSIDLSSVANSVIGGRFDTSNTGNRFDGSLSDFQIYDAYWSTDDIAYDYANPNKLAIDNPSTSLSVTNLKAYWALSEGDGLVAYDSGTNLEEEKVRNGDFALDSNWSEGAGWDIDVANNRITRTAQSGSTSASQNISFVSGKSYSITYTLNVSAGSFLIRLGGDGVLDTPARSVDDTYTEVVNASGNYTTLNLRAFDGTFAGSISNVSVREVTASDHGGIVNGATYVDAQPRIPQLGMMNWSKGSNLLTYSNDFSEWTLENTSISTSQSSYFNDTITKLKAGTSNDRQAIKINVTKSGDIVVSVIAKASEYSVLQLTDAFNGTYFVNFNLTNGTVGSSTGITGSIEDYGNGFYRCIGVYTSSSSIISYRISIAENSTDGRLLSFAGNGSDGLFIYSSQVESGSSASAYRLTDGCLLYTSPSPRDKRQSRMPSSA